MNTNVDHVLLTRFNLPSKGPESYIRARDGWLSERVALFERYCLPSVEAQTSSNFHWIVYFDPESPQWLRDRILLWSSEGTITAIFREEVPHAELISDIRAVTGARHRQLLSTNLDNDDGLSVDFVERLQQVHPADTRSAIYLTRGLIKKGGRLYSRTDRNNAFCSVREDWGSVVTCWADWHNLLSHQMPVLEIGGDAAWLQVIHDLNVSNRVRGRRIAPERIARSFGRMLDDVSKPSVIEMVAENLWYLPKRTIREVGRSTVKNMAMQVVGKDGVDRIKNHLQKVH
ncbi:glycosyltransferase [Paeniglutamicibacter sp. MACA_103]|uniref:glycosyltransferase n=1 Tax=Paeniglutamicibacter sp. MACA_103 TaxID=3377337 RepID=UPI0038941E44